MFWCAEYQYETLYEGYPLSPPGPPPREDMNWFCSDDLRFGVWILQWEDPESSGRAVPYRRSTLIQQKPVPYYPPLFVKSADERKWLTWIVDQYGFGRYGRVLEDGYIWMPQ
ncbi:hypothetical protein [Paenibacillus roseipurpureus]|uniref:Uncharacterized protein n=1 Tax=Paenibacillus roseopurpureus TaxID=2918901 RepID=A0AA96LSJ1_9BACL|nr:hypothetical protein [Paenibacillus sp. MBLB1832]WNR45118.1 hypothetical protein MJB10_02915 [Paenibacillus sp. MBLB1832]